MNSTAGVILAGTHCWEDSGLSGLLPRPLLPVAHTPLIGHTLSWLRHGAVCSVGICANSSSRLVRHVLGDGTALGMELEYYEDWTPRGPAGCVRDVAERLAADRLVIVEGSILPELDLQAVLRTHVARGAALTVAAVTEAAPGRGGNNRLAPAGVFVLECAALRHVPETGYQDLKEGLIPLLHARGELVIAHCVPEPCPRVIDESSYLTVSARALERLSHGGTDLAGYRRLDAGFAHASAQLSPAAQFVGPILVGPRTTIEALAVLVGPVAIGADCTIGAGAVLSRSIIWDDCHVGAGAHVDQCILAYGARVAAGQVCHSATRLASDTPPAPEAAAEADRTRRRSRRPGGTPSKVWPSGRDKLRQPLSEAV